MGCLWGIAIYQNNETTMIKHNSSGFLIPIYIYQVQLRYLVIVMTVDRERAFRTPLKGDLVVDTRVDLEVELYCGLPEGMSGKTRWLASQHYQRR